MFMRKGTLIEIKKKMKNMVEEVVEDFDEDQEEVNLKK